MVGSGTAAPTTLSTKTVPPTSFRRGKGVRNLLFSILPYAAFKPVLTEADERVFTNKRFLTPFPPPFPQIKGS